MNGKEGGLVKTRETDSAPTSEKLMFPSVAKPELLAHARTPSSRKPEDHAAGALQALRENAPEHGCSDL